MWLRAFGAVFLLLPLTVLAEDLALPRIWSTATLFPDGRVMVCGGNMGAGTDCEVFGRFPNGSRPGPQFNQSRNSAAGVMLPDGTWVVLGGGISTQAERLRSGATAWELISGSYSTRDDNAASLLDDGRVIAVGAAAGSSEAASLVIDAAAQSLGAGPIPLSARRTPSASRLLNGKVLFTGGQLNGLPLASAELFDSNLTAFVATGSMNQARHHHTQTVLTDGRVLVAGGYASDGGIQASAELYEPMSGTWGLTGSLSAPREGHLAALLPDGRVMLVGGVDSAARPIPNTEIFDPTTGQFSAGPALLVPRRWHVTVMLPTSELFIAGGEGDAGMTALVERLRVTSLSRTTGTPTRAARTDHVALLLPDGRVLALGGKALGDTVAMAELYDPSTQTWSDAGITEGRFYGAAAVLVSGEVLYCGGATIGAPLRTCLLYSPSAGTFTPTGSMLALRTRPQMVLLPDGRVMAASGYDDAGWVATSEIFDPENGQWSSLAQLPSALDHAKLRLLHDGTVLATSNQVFRYRPATNAWTVESAMASPRTHHATVVLPDGRLVAFSGVGSAAVEAFLPDASTWQVLQTMPVPRHDYAAVPMDDGRVVLVGGQDEFGVATDDLHVWDSVRDSWSTLGPMDRARDENVTVWMPTGDALIIGGNDPNAQSHDSTEVVNENRSPQRSLAPSLDPVGPIWPGARLKLTGARLTGLTEGHGGLYHSTAGTVPQVTLRRLGDDLPFVLALEKWAPTGINALLPANLPLGWYHVRVTVNGVPSIARPLRIGRAPGASCVDGALCASQRCASGTCTELFPSTDGGVEPDAGVPVDAGVGRDGGEVTDGGIPGPGTYRVGCGCGSSAGGGSGLALALALLRRRRAAARRAGQRADASSAA